MNTTSLWQAISPFQQTYPALNTDINVDVVIIGGGITGVTAAMHLIAGGKTVAVLEANQIGSGTTGYSTGNLYVGVQPFYQNIVSKFNEETASVIARSRQSAINFIEDTIKAHKIDCQFARHPWFLQTNLESKISFLEKEVELIKKFGVNIKYTTALPLPFPYKKAAVMENQARFNPAKYVQGLAAKLAEQNCHIFENTRVIDIEEKDLCTVKTNSGNVFAKKVLIATHTPIGFNIVQMFTAPYRSYVVASRLQDNYYPEGHFVDLGEKEYHSSCTHPFSTNTPELLLTAGSHHKTGQDKNAIKHFGQLEKYQRDRFAVSEVAYQWSAQHYHSADNVPYIGLSTRFTKNIYMATGYFADGLVYGTIAAQIISDIILEKNNSLIQTFEANRFKPIASSPFLAKEGMNVFMQYLKDYTVPLPKDNYADLQIGEGRVMEINKHKCAVSRDVNNQIHIVSAVCTHLNCLVDWNNAEKTWDCPCHGSRFTATGKVIEGPAEKDLEAKEG